MGQYKFAGNYQKVEFQNIKIDLLQKIQSFDLLIITMFSRSKVKNNFDLQNKPVAVNFSEGQKYF
jgi:hypothetical protein